MLRAPCSRLAYFSLHRLIGSRMAKHYREFLALENYSSPYLKELQADRLLRLLAKAIADVPFYRDRVQPGKNLALQDFPVLTKADIQQNFQNLMSPRIQQEHSSGKRYRSYSWLAVQTGGSTGMPTMVIHDKEFRDLNRAARLYTQYLCGFPIGAPHFKLWGSMREINHARESLQQRTSGFLSGEIIFNAFKMEDAEIDSYIQRINNSSVEYMMAYSDAAHRMARRIQQTNRRVRPLKAVMACAGTLTEEMRGTIANAFGGANIHNMYGSRDCGAMACECSHQSLHVLDNKVILEAVDQQGTPVPAGQPGRILVTILGNYGFPLIRYEIGDVGVLTDKICECGLPTQVLGRVEGRSIEFLVTTKGGYISPTYFRHLIGVFHNPGAIRRFQIVQYARDRAVLALEKEPGTSDAALGKSTENIRRDLIAVFGPGMNLQINVVDRIPEADSGKFIFAINKIRQSETP